jgi:Family of unknown function (DUF6011)
MSGVLTMPAKMASEKQLGFLSKLITERDGKLDESKQAILDSYKTLIADKTLRMDAASASIDMLLSADWKPAASKDAMPPAIPNGTYTVVLDAASGDYVTIRIATEKWCDGKVVASYLAGSDNESSYKGFAFVNENGINVWKRFAGNERLAAALEFLTGNLTEAHEKFLEMAEAYAMESGKCMRCGRKLTVPTSLHRGLGPECASKEGM